MVKARVELIGAASHHTNGRTFYSGQPQILTVPHEIRKYQNMGDFSVEIIKDKPTKQKLEDIKKSDEIDEIDEVDEEFIEDVEDGNAEKIKDKTNNYTRKELMKFKKSELSDVAKELGLDSSGTRFALIKRILGD